MQTEKILLELGKKVRTFITIYVTLVVTPAVGYLVYFGGRLTLDQLFGFIILVLIASGASQAVTISIRHGRFKTLQSMLDEIDESEGEHKSQKAKELKAKLISFPVNEAILLTSGTLLAFIIFYVSFIIFFKTTAFFTASLILTLIFVGFYLPILALMLAERLTGNYISIPQLNNQKVEIKDIRFIGERGRRIWMMLAIVLLPTLVLGMVAVQASMGLLSATELYFHFGAGFAMLIFYIAILLYEAQRNSIGLMVSAIGNLEKGELSSQNIPMTSSSEIGFLMQDIDSFHNRLYGIVRSILNATSSVTSGSKQINQSANGISATASEQAANIEQTSASLEEITARVSETAERSKDTLSAAQETARYSDEGKHLLQQVIADMRQVSEKTNLVETIAGQTNLLALNASIEAARAGEHGRGFSVVASEVGKLAEDSRSSAKEITDLVRSTLEASEQAGNFFEMILPKINETAELFEQITHSSDEEKTGIDQINMGMAQLNEIAQSNAAASEELSALADQMRMYAEELEKEMLFFKIKN